MRSYLPALPLVIYALAVASGCTARDWLLPFLLIEAAAIVVYAHDVRERLRARARHRRQV
jgi:hypothetical protein